MLRRTERLSRAAFNEYLSVGRRFHSPLAQLVYTPDTERHVAVVVSKKIARSAVLRNKIRRRVYGLARLHATTGVYIFIMKSAAVTCTYGALKEHLITLIEHATQTKI